MSTSAQKQNRHINAALIFKLSKYKDIKIYNFKKLLHFNYNA